MWCIVRDRIEGSWLPHPGTSSATKTALTKDHPPRIFETRKQAKLSLAHWLRGEIERKAVWPDKPWDDATWEQYVVEGTSREHMRDRMEVAGIDIHLVRSDGTSSVAVPFSQWL